MDLKLKKIIKNNKEKIKILIVDDEPDILDTLEDLLSSCEVTKAGGFEEAKAYLAKQSFDMTVLDIMGVSGYDLLEIAVKHDVLIGLVR